jgi:hypothetical protein
MKEGNKAELPALKLKREDSRQRKMKVDKRYFILIIFKHNIKIYINGNSGSL